MGESTTDVAVSTELDVVLKAIEAGHVRLTGSLADGIRSPVHHTEKFGTTEFGQPVAIRPVQEEYEGKTFLGIFMGDVATGTVAEVTGDAIELGFGGHNPLVYVPELRRSFFGYESWWAVIQDESQLRSITNKDIENLWYVKALRETFGTKSPESADDTEVPDPGSG